MIKKFNELDNNKKILIVVSLAVILIVGIILYVYFKNENSGFKNIKENEDKELVYTINSKKNKDFFIDVPYINIKGDYIKSVNEDINSYVEEFINEEMVRLTYEYEINGKVLSLVIKVANYNTDDVPEIYFKTYNVNLDTLVLLSDDYLLRIYNTNYESVKEIIEKRFQYFYKDLIEQEYFDEEECEYECFLENRGVEDYMDDVSYYIEGGKLVAYKPFVFYSIIGEENYFKEEDLKFIIAKEES